MAGAGELRHRISLWKRGDGEDDWGQPIPGAGPFEEQGQAWAKIHPLRGGEEVMAARLTGVQPVIFTVRHSTLTKQITSAWEIKTDDGTTWDVNAISDPDGRKKYLEILAQSPGQS
ncbi:phage head closure protein [Pelagibacterium flavum]|uniref:Phage head closure protein n=1 Tax=Pelagibacterium flavum TaxID=2984530 RepID=A0ABY6IJ68_9HYPH|nr:phage head closure protein [Pelagibacterium sp. YIM 151497]UYQ70651.1 phage head closure protein [Pelagibacterium sp. YIM 151497]